MILSISYPLSISLPFYFLHSFLFFFLMIRRPPRSTLFPSRRSSDLYGKVKRDPHGHLRLGEIEFGRMVKDRLTTRLEQRDLKVALIDKDLGYELRCADPIPFDAEYTRDLGYGAVKFLRSEAAARFGAIISFVDGRMRPIPFDDMINPKTGRMQPRKVDVDGEAYECARHYMI